MSSQDHRAIRLNDEFGHVKEIDVVGAKVNEGLPAAAKAGVQAAILGQLGHGKFILAGVAVTNRPPENDRAVALNDEATQQIGIDICAEADESLAASAEAVLQAPALGQLGHAKVNLSSVPIIDRASQHNRTVWLDDQVGKVEGIVVVAKVDDGSAAGTEAAVQTAVLGQLGDGKVIF